MRKLFALYTNEMIKTSKKISIIVLLVIMVVIIFAFGALVKYQSDLNSNDDYSEQYQKEEVKRQLEDAKIKVINIQDKKATASPEEKAKLQLEEKLVQNRVDMLQYSIDSNIAIYSESYRAQAIKKMFNLKDTADQLKAVVPEQLTDQQKIQLVNAEADITALESVINNKDFKEYVAFLNRETNNNPTLSEEEKKIYLDSNELKQKYNITGEVDGKAVDGNAFKYIYILEKAKLSLLKDLDYTGDSQNLKPLTPDSRQEIKDMITVIEHNFSKGLITNNPDDRKGNDMASEVIPFMLNIGNFMIVILIMILAGGSVSSEMSTGSIKSLIISPTKRWKIFAAKYFSLLSAGIVAALIAYIFSLLASGIFFGFEAGLPYVYASDGIAYELNFHIYQLGRLCTDFIVVLVYMTFAFMLSILTRNTAVSVALTIAVYFIGNTANAIIMQFFKGEWLRFIPFNNLNLTTKIFPNDIAARISGGTPASELNSLSFSLVYVAVLLICMIYIGLDSFNRRDIK